MWHRNALISKFLCSRVQCGNSTQLRRSMNGPLNHMPVYIVHRAKAFAQLNAVQTQQVLWRNRVHLWVSGITVRSSQHRWRHSRHAYHTYCTCCICTALRCANALLHDVNRHVISSAFDTKVSSTVLLTRTVASVWYVILKPYALPCDWSQLHSGIQCCYRVVWLCVINKLWMNWSRLLCKNVWYERTTS